MDFPVEIRNRIYSTVLVRDRRIDLSTQKQWKYKPQSAEVTALKQPPLTRVCKAIRNETLPIFYGCNAIMINLSKVPDRFIARRWLLDIGPSNRNLLCNCGTYWNPDDFTREYAAFAATAEENLRKDGIMAKMVEFIPDKAEHEKGWGYARMMFEDAID